MNSTDFDRIIAQERKVLASIKEAGEKLIPEFKRITASYIRELSIELMRSYFKHKPQAAKSLGSEKLEEMKREFSAILDSLPEQTGKRLDAGQIWLHREEIPDRAVTDMSYSYNFERRSNKSMDDAIRDLIGLVGSMLIKYGFVETDKDFTWTISPAGIPQYANDLPSRGMDHYRTLNKLMEQYKDLLVEYVFAIQNLRKAEHSKNSDQPLI